MFRIAPLSKFGTKDNVEVKIYPVQLAKQETLTHSRYLISPHVHECPPWYCIVDVTLTMHKFFLYFTRNMVEIDTNDYSTSTFRLKWSKKRYNLSPGKQL